jgi:hypothetical protein
MYSVIQLQPPLVRVIGIPYKKLEDYLQYFKLLYKKRTYLFLIIIDFSDYSNYYWKMKHLLKVY